MTGKGKIAIILGNDHTNTLGLVQSLGREGYRAVSYVWGLRTGIVSASRYSGSVIHCENENACVDRIIDDFKDVDSKIPILCACDSAAVTLENRKEHLGDRFVFESCSSFTLNAMQEKSLQVSLAAESGFNVPLSTIISGKLPEEIGFEPPFLYKALKSIEGDKGDLTICNSYKELVDKAAKTLRKTPRILVQQYIDHDYEISILGCAVSDGDCILPAVENKLTIFPANVGLECLARLEPLNDPDIIQPIRNLIKRIGYIGLFSVEMMHNRIDGKFYFTEINLRNDGANSFIRKFGVNLPLIHVRDLAGEYYSELCQAKDLADGYYIWEMHHFYSMLYKDISFAQWLKELFSSRGFLVFEMKDPMPFLRQFSFPITRRIKRLLRIR